jgi:hypothetical protein
LTSTGPRLVDTKSDSFGDIDLSAYIMHIQQYFADFQIGRWPWRSSAATVPIAPMVFTLRTLEAISWVLVLPAIPIYRLLAPNDLPVRQFWVSTQRLRRIESRDSQRLLCYLRDDLCDVVCIFVGRVVVEPAPEAGIGYSLLQTYIGTGEVSSFPDGTCPKVVGARNSRETSLRLAERRKMATICCLHGSYSPPWLEDCPSFMGTKRSNLDASERGRY